MKRFCQIPVASYQQQLISETGENAEICVVNPRPHEQGGKTVLGGSFPGFGILRLNDALINQGKGFE